MSASKWSEQEILARVVRHADLVACRNAFIDTRTPGSELKENFTIIGPGVAENPDQHVHIDIAHGFNIGAARQPPGCVNSQHSHDTAEVFVVHTGRWAFTLGEFGDDARVELGPGDAISIPTQVFRGFTNVGSDTGFLFAVLGGDDPGRVKWAPAVFDAAREHGLILLESGRLIDTSSGETIPDGARPMTPTTADEVARFRRMTHHELARCVWREDTAESAQIWPFGAGCGVAESPVIGAVSDGSNLSAGRMNWAHGFRLSRLRLAPGARTPRYRREEAEVVLVHAGQLIFAWEDNTVELNAGDVITAPTGMARSYFNAGGTAAMAYVVRAGDSPNG